MAQLLEDEDLQAALQPTRSSEMRLDAIGGYDAGSIAIQASPVSPGFGLVARPGTSSGRVWPLALASPPPALQMVAAGGAKEQGGGQDEDPRSKDEKMALGDVDESLATFGWDVEKGGVPPHLDLNQTAVAGAKQQPGKTLLQSDAKKGGWTKVRAAVQVHSAVGFVQCDTQKGNVNKQVRERKKKKKGSFRKIVKSNVENAWDIFLSYRVAAAADLKLVRCSSCVHMLSVL